jgi:hypothetical protein
MMDIEDAKKVSFEIKIKEEGSIKRIDTTSIL